MLPDVRDDFQPVRSYNDGNMTLTWFSKSVLTFVIVLVLFAFWMMPSNAQDESTAGNEVDLGEPSSAPADAELSEGVLQGIYWWTDPDPAAMMTLVNFGVDSIAFRLGRVTVSRSQGNLPMIAWLDGGNYESLSDLPTGIEYRPVIETDESVWTGNGPQLLAAFVTAEVIPGIESFIPGAGSIEIKLPDESGSGPGRVSYTALETFLAVTLPMDAPRRDTELLIGIQPSFLAGVSRADLQALSAIMDGVVVYFTDYDYSGISPRITDRQWIDATSAELEALGLPFVAVIPIYNRALAYRGTSAGGPIVLPAVDIQTLAESSEIRHMGAAGTEYTLTSDLEVAGTVFSPGDTVRILESLQEVSPGDLMVEIPAMAPSCTEIDLFRLPLVPGFDPPPMVAFEAAGWVSGGRVTDEIDPFEAEKGEMDQKHNQFQQIIMFVTLGLMMFVLMRMFSKGAAKTKDGGGK